MKKIVSSIMIFICFCSFAQTRIVFSVQQIDSIAEKNRSHLFDAGEVISIKQNDIEIGSGISSYNYFLYKPEEDRLQKLPLSDRKTGKPLKNKQLIKGHYSETVHYTLEAGGQSTRTLLELYYRCEKPFLARITKTTSKEGTQLKSDVYEYEMADGIFPEAISHESRQLIENKNEKILYYFRR